MAAAKESPSKGAGKRKRDSNAAGDASTSSASTSKKAKSSSQAASVAELEATLLDPDTPSLNPLADLLVHMQSKRAAPEETHAAIFAAYRVFVSLVARGLFAPGSSLPAEVKTWLYARLDEYTAFLSGLLQHEEQALRDGAMQILFSLLKHLSESISSATGTPQVHIYVWRTIVRGVLEAPEVDIKEYLAYDDLRWLFLRDMAAVMKNDDPAPTLQMASRAFGILESLDRLPTSSKDLTFFLPAFSKPPSKAAMSASEEHEEGGEDADEDDWRAFFDKPAAPKKQEEKYGRAGRLNIHARMHVPPAHRAQLVTAWLAVLPRISGSEADSVRALSILHLRLVPHLKKEEAVRTMDWIAGCVDYGDASGLLALNTLFELMTTMNLDYPDLYVRLYAYLDRNTLHFKHRARFFRMLERMLASTHLPATLIASFIKRLSRLSLSAPPAAVVAIIPLVYNLLKRHPTCMPLIHRDSNPGENNDPYDPSETSPLKSRALESSLWELQSQTAHYHAPTAVLAKVFSEPFTKPNYAMEDFLDHSYSTMFDAETGGKRGIRIKTAPAVRDEDDTVDLVSEIWAF
ncbi:CBF-domain-containing protein [Auricularia subglabra TFB-10046 SS5]|nr:CBF-domain-containing protein [Auricularia subglabra TFB-10046 SS5]